MDNQITKDTTTQDYSAYRSVRYSLKVVFSCLTAIPFFVFAYIYFRIGALNTALSGALVALSMVLVFEGFIILGRWPSILRIYLLPWRRLKRGR